MTNAPIQLRAGIRSAGTLKQDAKGIAVTKFSNSLAASTLIAAGLACVAAPASAEEQNASAATVAATASAAASATSADNKKYCIVESLTGSRMPKKLCRTKAEWQREGVDISAKSK
jgi:hypothetical protein